MAPTSTGLDPHVTWVLLSSFLVALMQAGFACLESGMVRAKNSINVAIKNLVDFCISCALFTLVGYGLMYGPSVGGWIGLPDFPLDPDSPPADVTFFIFQAMFCGTAATIISGAVSERMRFIGYILVTVVTAAVIYPVAGHWVWNGAAHGVAGGWLAQMGFLDFAGSTVVHSVGGWVSLAAILVIGPRIGRFGQAGRPIDGHNLPMATLGVFLLWFGFFGFNGGSTLALNASVPIIIANTALAGACGGLAALAASWLTQGMPRVDRIINGVLAGLVASCAGCNIMGAEAAMVVGLIAGLLVVASMRLLEHMEVDDVIGAVPSHLVAGAWGTLAVALLARPDVFPTADSRLHQLVIQATGVAAVGVFSFGVPYVLLRLLDRVMPLRVSADDERIGLNIAEHGAGTALLDLVTQMDQHTRMGDFSRPVVVEPETEAHHIATFYNAVLEKVTAESDRRHQALARLHELAHSDALTGLPNRRLFFESLIRALARARRSAHGGAVMYFDLDGFKAVNDTLGHEAGDELLLQVAARMRAVLREGDLLARLGGDEFALIIENAADDEAPVAVAEKVLDALAEPFVLRAGAARIGVSIGIARFGALEAETAEAVLKRADAAMYDAKLAGKNTWRLMAA